MSEFRRRLMMDPSSVINKIKQLGCIMWFPLNSTSRLTDIIGGRTLVQDIFNTISNQTTRYMFTFAVNRIGHIDISDLAESDFVNGGFTTYFEAMRYYSSNAPDLSNTAAIWRINGVSIGFGINTNGDTNSRNWSGNIWYKSMVVAHQDQAGTREVYSNGSIVLNTSRSYPNIWNYSTIDLIGNNNSRLYAKNFLLFNRALNANEVAKVYQIVSQ